MQIILTFITFDTDNLTPGNGGVSDDSVIKEMSFTPAYTVNIEATVG